MKTNRVFSAVLFVTLFSIVTTTHGMHRALVGAQHFIRFGAVVCWKSDGIALRKNRVDDLAVQVAMSNLKAS